MRNIGSKKLIISDLHLGSPLFTFESEQRILNLLRDEVYSEIILCGDILDAWEDDPDDIVSDNNLIIEVINSISQIKPVIYIVGNHDPSTEFLSKVFPYISIVDKNKYYVFNYNTIMIHGHEFDDLIVKYSWLARILHYVHWVCERLFKINIKAFFRNIFYSISAKIKKRYYTDLVLNVEEDAVDAYKSKCQNLIMGHTHFPKLTYVDGFTYVNSGDWIHNNSYVEYDNVNEGFRLKILKRYKWIQKQ